MFTIARIHGTGFGMPTPGLLPTKKEWAEQREIVAKTIRRLERKGLKADGHVLGTRNATKKILAEAQKEGCDAIVMAADPDRNRVHRQHDVDPGAPARAAQGQAAGVPGARRDSLSLERRIRARPRPGGRAAAPA